VGLYDDDGGAEDGLDGTKDGRVLVWPCLAHGEAEGWEQGNCGLWGFDWGLNHCLIEGWDDG